jgi:hypothetical protein
MTWSNLTRSFASPWGEVDSYTTHHNLSRFVLLNPSEFGSDGVDLISHLRTEDARARGFAFYFTTHGYILLSVRGDLLI